MLSISILLFSWVGFSPVSAMGVALFLTLKNTTVALSDSWWVMRQACALWKCMSLMVSKLSGFVRHFLRSKQDLAYQMEKTMERGRGQLHCGTSRGRCGWCHYCRACKESPSTSVWASHATSGVLFVAIRVGPWPDVQATSSNQLDMLGPVGPSQWTYFKAQDLQTAIRSAEATGGIVASAVKGTLVSKLTPQGAILSNAVTSAS